MSCGDIFLRLQSFSKKLGGSALFHTFFSSLCSVIIISIIYPDLFILYKISFIRFMDTEFNYAGVFTVVSNLYHGGIQLWNPYDQMPLAYYHLTGGLYTFSNVLTTIIYALVSPFFDFSGKSFHVMFSMAFFCTTLLMRTVGFYLLLKRFCHSPLVLFCCTVVGSTLLSPHMYLGLNCASLYSFFPLLVHFILRFFEDFKLNHFLMALLVFVLSVSFDPMVGLGYFYQGVHFIILGCIVWTIFWNRLRLRRFAVSLLTFLRSPKWDSYKRHFVKILVVIFVSGVVIAPSIYLLLANYGDYDFAGEKSRMVNPLSIKEYFSRPVFYAPQREILFRLVDFTRNDWGTSWLFLGYTTVFLVAFGVMMNKDSRKYIFLSTAFIFWMINSPRDLLNFAHWLNALTNPLKFVPRSFHMTGAFLLPYVILPVLALGAQSLYNFVCGRKGSESFFHYQKLALFSLLIVFFFLVFPSISWILRFYLGIEVLISFLLLLLLWKWQWSFKVRSSVIGGLFLLLLMGDSFGMSYYLRAVSKKVEIIPHQITGLESVGPLVLDYQNPKLLPYRECYNVNHLGQVASYMAVDPVHMQGLYYRYTNFEKYFRPATNYTPRHVSYSRIAYDRDLQEYLKQNTQLIYQADLAVEAGQRVLGRILDQGLGRRVIMVHGDPSQELKFFSRSIFTKTLPDHFNLSAQKKRYLSWKKFVVPLNTGETSYSNKSLIFCSFELPPDFPSYLTTGVFTQDQFMLKVSLDGKKFTPAQGWLTRSFTFDVNNLSSGKLVIALPKGYFLESLSKVTLEYQAKEAFNVRRYEPDNFEFDYRSDHDGWLVFHYPYDKKWKLSVDGKPVKIFQVNHCFLGIPIQEGTHKILLQYWPDTWLREMTMLAIFFQMLAILFVMRIGYREYTGNSNCLGKN
ncbi:MAG: YfhO family protein [Chlamydiae bacterium]|nr:YfhO family protein [Chlamydiota bacterium]